MKIEHIYLGLAIIGIIGVLSVISYEIRNWWSDRDDGGENNRVEHLR
jgi:hypothetical protein